MVEVKNHLVRFTMACRKKSVVGILWRLAKQHIFAKLIT